jgi:hypothetical protein
MMKDRQYAGEINERTDKLISEGKRKADEIFDIVFNQIV